MSSDFSFKDYSLSPIDLIPDDDEDVGIDEMDARQVHYCELAHHLDTEDLMAVVGDELAQSDVLRSLIDEIKEHPYLPGERRALHVMDAIRLGNEVAQLISQAMDDQIGMRQACLGSQVGHG
jgi:hypothetical protein